MFEGSGLTAEHPVGAGIDTIMCQDGRIVSYASGVNVDWDNELQAWRTLGHHGNRGLKSLGYSMNFSVETFLLRQANVEGAIIEPGFQPDGRNTINSAGYFDFSMIDLHTLEVLASLISCKPASGNLQFQSNGLNTKTGNWQGLKCLPGLQTS